MNCLIKSRIRSPGTICPIRLFCQTTKFFYLKNLDLILHRGEIFLDRCKHPFSEEHVGMDASILADVHCRPHAKIHEDFPHCVIDWELTGTKTVVQHDNFLTYTRKSLVFQHSICFDARIVVHRRNFPIFAGHRVELPQTVLFCAITLCIWGSTRCCVIAHKCNELPCAQCNRTRNCALLRQSRSLPQSAQVMHEWRCKRRLFLWFVGRFDMTLTSSIR